MQNHTVRLKTLQKQQMTLKIPIDYTLYQVKKQAARLCPRTLNKPISSFDVLLDGNKVLDLTRKVSEIARDSSSLIEIIEKQYVQNDEYHYQQKAQFAIAWEGVSYNVTLSKKASILDLKNKITEMLGLSSNFFVKYGEMEVPFSESLSKYILCSNLVLEKCQKLQKAPKLEKTELPTTDYFQKGARLVESVTSSEKENRDRDVQPIDGSSQAPGNHALNANQTKKSNIETRREEISRQNSLRDVIIEEEGGMKNLASQNHKIVLKKSCSSINGSRISTHSTKQISQCKKQLLTNNEGIPQPRNFSFLARHLESEAKQTYSVNSSTESDMLDFEELFINFIIEDQSRCYTLECNRDMQLEKAVQKLAKLENVPVGVIMLFHFQGKKSKFLKNSGQQVQDRKQLIPEGMKVFELADPKQKEHTIYYRYASAIEVEAENHILMEELLKGKEKADSEIDNQNSVMEEKLKVVEGANFVQIHDPKV